MDIKKSFKKLEISEEFKKWKEEHSQSYLCSCFIMFGETMENKELMDWQFDFFCESDGKLHSFIVSDFIKQQDEDEAFKKKETKLFKLDLGEVKINLNDACEIVNQNKEHKTEKFTKKIIILQNLGEGAVWNISMITDTFNVFNVKMSARDGKVLEKKNTSLLSFKAN